MQVCLSSHIVVLAVLQDCRDAAACAFRGVFDSVSVTSGTRSTCAWDWIRVFTALAIPWRFQEVSTQQYAHLVGLVRFWSEFENSEKLGHANLFRVRFWSEVEKLVCIPIELVSWMMKRANSEELR